MRLHTIPVFLALLAPAAALAQPLLENASHAVRLADDGTFGITCRGSERTFVFRPAFLVLAAAADPELALRPANLGVPYNVATWRVPGDAADEAVFHAGRRQDAQHGDGFDDRILSARPGERRTADPFRAGRRVLLEATRATVAGDTILFQFPANPDFELTARLEMPASGYPQLEYELVPYSERHYSVAYVGAPDRHPDDVEEIWQPLVWTGKRFPVQSFLTLAFRCPLPTALAQVDGHTIGVLADPSEFPFDPLPLFDNSRFGVAIRNSDGLAQPLLFAPVLGGSGSRIPAGEPFRFKARLVVEPAPLVETYARIARDLFGFRDYRDNALGPLNDVLDRMIDYAMSPYARFIPELKGCSYSTDVPDAVKNVSSLHPLNIALLRDDPAIFEQRAYPIMEYLLSREKFLFTLDREQKIQNPSRRMAGPAAPMSELTSLFGISHGANPFLLRLARGLYGVDRILNLDLVVPGDRWQHSLALYQATGDAHLLAKAMEAADRYIAGNRDRPPTDFSGNPFFWTEFVPDFSWLVELYEATGERRYLDAARDAARRYCLYTWMAPAIPEQPVLVNAGDKAPVYWYLKRYSEQPLHAPEEWVPAWRLSETGLTPESSGTSSGHRAIFMANHAPWLLRIAALSGDTFLHDVARAAIVGRYRNFPGYHINTARTTVYEKAGYPLRGHRELNVNSFHYNHIWPQISFLFDFLVTDTWQRSTGAVSFPSAYIEGYAYLQNKFYGHRTGRFYDYDDAVLWMPKGLFHSSSGQLNGLSARGDGRAYFAFTNQSGHPVESTIRFDRDLLNAPDGDLPVQLWVNNEPVPAGPLAGDSLVLLVPPGGIAALAIGDVAPQAPFQQSILGLSAQSAWRNDYLESSFGGARAMILNWGPGRTRAYIYLQADDAVFQSVSLHLADGSVLEDDSYPFEFTVPLDPGASAFTFHLTATTVSGEIQKSPPLMLSKGEDNH